MSAKWTFWAWDQPIKSAPKKLALLQLANNANDDGKSWYSISKMAIACGVSERTFQRSIKDLEVDHLLHVERRSNRPSIYQLKDDEIEITLTDFQGDAESQLSLIGGDSVSVQGDSVSVQGDRESHDLNSTPNNDLNKSNKDKVHQDKPSDYSDDFEAIWAMYPKRSGSNPKKKAYQYYNARIKEGVQHSVMCVGLGRYVNFINGTNQDKKFIMQGQRFFGTGEEYLNDWSFTVRSVTASNQDVGNIDHSNSGGFTKGN